MDILEKISGINQDYITGPQKIELPKLEKISPHMSRKTTMEFKSFHDEKKKEYSREEVVNAVDSANKLLDEKQDIHCKFQIHEATDRIMVKLIDRKTEKVIKEIPTEKILDLIGDIWERLGILVDERG